MGTPIPSTEVNGIASGKQAIAKVSYTHDAMVDYILMKPEASQAEIALYFGFTTSWISTVVNSDAFKARLAARKVDVVDVVVKQRLEERFETLAHQSLDIIQKKLQATQSLDGATKALELSAKALGFGARERGGTGVSVNFVVALPEKATDQEQWAAQARSGAVKQHFIVPAPAEIQDVAPNAPSAA